MGEMSVLGEATVRTPAEQLVEGFRELALLEQASRRIQPSLGDLYDAAIEEYDITDAHDAALLTTNQLIDLAVNGLTTRLQEQRAREAELRKPYVINELANLLKSLRGQVVTISAIDGKLIIEHCVPYEEAYATEGHVSEVRGTIVGNFSWLQTRLVIDRKPGPLRQRHRYYTDVFDKQTGQQLVHLDFGN